MSIDEDSDDNVLTFRISDLETDISDLEIYVVSTDSNYILSSEISINSVDNATGVVVAHVDAKHDAYTVVAADGEDLVKIMVSDGNKIAEAFVDVTIVPINDEPVANDDGDMTAEWPARYEDTTYTTGICLHY